MSQYEMNLLEYLAWKLGCQYLSDLHYLDSWRRRCLVCAVQEINPADYGVAQWNDALEYLTKELPEKTAAAAYKRLVAILSGKLVDNGGTVKKKSCDIC